MGKLYGMELPENPNKILCKKCHSYYERRSGKQICPWCSEPKDMPANPQQPPVKVTAINTELSNYMKNATLEQKTKILKFIEDEL